MQYINRMCHCKLTIPLFQTSQTYRLSEHLLVAAAAVTLHCCYTIDGLLMIQFNCASCSGVPNNIQVAHAARDWCAGTVTGWGRHEPLLLFAVHDEMANTSAPVNLSLSYSVIVRCVAR